MMQWKQLKKKIQHSKGYWDEVDDGIPFETKMAGFISELKEQMKKEKEMDEEIKKQLNNIGFKI